MSVEFTLSDSSLTLDEWDQLVTAHCDPDLVPDDRDSLAESGTAFVLVAGSVRGVFVYHDGPEMITVRLSALASRADWKVAYALAGAALEQGGGSFLRETGDALEAGDLTDARAEQDALGDFVPTLKMVRAGLAESDAKLLELPLDRFNLLLRLEDLPEGDDEEAARALEAKLAERVKRCSTAYFGHTLVLEGGVRLATWARIPTVVGEVHLVACSGLDPEGEGALPLERLLALLGERAEQMGNGCWLLPELDLDGDPPLKEALVAELVQVDAWAEASRERLEREAAEAAEAVGAEARSSEAGSVEERERELDALRGILAFVITKVGAGESRDAVRESLVLEGVPKDLAETATRVVGLTLSKLVGGDPKQPPQPEQVMRSLIQEGIPGGLASLALEVASSVLHWDGQEDPQD